MSDVTIKTWVTLNADAFNDFNDYVANVLEGGIFRAVAEYFHRKLKDSDKAELELPWGTYSAEVKGRGEAGVINISWDPSKGFKNLLNDSSSANAASKYERNYQDEFDPEFVKLMTDYIAYGMFDPDKPENREKAAKQKGIELSDAEVTYFLNGYTLVLYNIAKEKQRNGKKYRLEINNAFPHGDFDFDYKDDGEIEVKFIPHKVFKQAVKDDERAASAREGDYTKLTEVKVERFPAADGEE